MRLDVLDTQIEVDLSALPTPHQEQIRAEWQQCLAADGVSRGEAKRIQVKDEGKRTNYALHRQVTRVLIEENAGRLVMFHAGAVADDTGLVIGFVAPSGTGKTTFAREFGKRWGYVTDETLALRPDGTVLPYPKPLSLGSQARGDQKVGMAPATAGMKPLGGEATQLRLAGIIILDRFDWYEDAPALTELSPLQAAAQIMEQTSSMLLHSNPLDTLARITQAGAGAWKLRYRDAADCVEAVEYLFATAHAATDAACGSECALTESAGTSWQCLGPGPVTVEKRFDADTGMNPTARPVPSPDPSFINLDEDAREAVQIARADWVDALLGEDGEVLVALANMAYLLSPLAGSIWLECAQPRRFSELLATITDRHGEVEDAAQILAARVSELTMGRILRLNQG